MPCPSGVWVPQQQEEGRTVVHKGLTHFPLPIWPELDSPGAPSCPGAALLCSQPQIQGRWIGTGTVSRAGESSQEGSRKGGSGGAGEGNKNQTLVRL